MEVGNMMPVNGVSCSAICHWPERACRLTPMQKDSYCEHQHNPKDQKKQEHYCNFLGHQESRKPPGLSQPLSASEAMRADKFS